MLPPVTPLYSPNFNPRSREGSDDVKLPVSADQTDFNPRSREGSDTRMIPYLIDLLYFNPRSREGSDVTAAGTAIPRTLFQSALPRGERQVRPVLGVPF